jgi:hypothetical protein
VKGVSRGIPLGQFITGTLALVASLWVAVLVLIRTLVAGPETWAPPDYAAVALRGILVACAIAASAAWMAGRRWSGGTALAVGPLACAMLVFGLLTGAFLGDLIGGSAWILAAAAAAAAATVAAIPSHGGSGGSTRAGDPSALTRQVLGALAGLGAIGVGVWQIVVHAPLAPDSGAATLSIAAWSVTCAASLTMVILLFARPPAGRTHACALIATVLLVGLPAWVASGAALFGAQWEAIAPVAGLGGLLGLPALAEMVPAGVSGNVITTYGILLSAGAVLVLVVFLRTDSSRGSTLAGFSLAWGAIWVSGLVLAVV